MYDLIGDIHGHADELIELLELLGYRCSNGVYRHSSRKAVFVGDFIDRGPKIRDVLTIVRKMVNADAAEAVMGNHEFNALAFHTLDPANTNRFLREHSNKNVAQHAETLKQVASDELADCLEWFRGLPMWLELDGVRVVHACWDRKQIEVLESAQSQHGGVTTSFLVEALSPGTALFHAIEDVLKGKELEFQPGVSFLDKDGHKRRAMRVQWYRRPVSDETYARYALPPGQGLPTDPLPASVAQQAVPYPVNAGPVFFGHYWLRADQPVHLAKNVACLDYSVAKGGSLCAYRWDGEKEIDNDKFVMVRATPRNPAL